MFRYAVCCMFLIAAGAARAAEQPATETTSAAVPTDGAGAAVSDTTSGSAPAAEAPSPGTPSDGTATVSPATVAQAVSRVDEGTAGKGTSFDVSVGTSLATGNFGTGQHSHLWSSALGGRIAFGTLRISASIPYLHIRSNGVIFSGIDSTPVIVAGAGAGPRQTVDGFGDVTVGAAYTLPASHGPEIEFSGRVKLPTASDSSHLSSGKTDYSGGVQVTQKFGMFAPFLAGTYRVFGDPAGIDLKNGFAASGGTAVVLGDRTVALVSYHYAQAASRLVKDAQELFAGASTRVASTGLRLTGFVTAGLTSGAAARSGGLSLSFEF